MWTSTHQQRDVHSVTKVTIAEQIKHRVPGHHKRHNDVTGLLAKRLVALTVEEHLQRQLVHKTFKPLAPPLSIK